ncbi:MAG: ROK family protein, partial [Clostridia bacterium]|nr:ROK family protein [Clostridia bacterium]
YIGIDLGGTNIAVGVVSEDGKIIKEGSVPTGSSRPTGEIVKDMAELSKKLTRECGMDISEIKAVGIGCPGTIDSVTGEVVYSNNIKMEHYPLAEEFKKHIDLPVKVDNDANCAAMGEYVASVTDAKNFLLITLGTGIGGGLVLNGEMYRGFNCAAVEVGHITLVSGGEPCSCGKRGCWESYASVTALIRQTKEAMEKHPESLMHKYAEEKGKVSGRTAFDAAKAGDDAAREVVAQYARYVADGIVSCENFMQPEVIAVGGGISREGEYLLEPVREYINGHRYNKFMPKTKLVTAKLFNDAGIIGAAMIAKMI